MTDDPRLREALAKAALLVRAGKASRASRRHLEAIAGWAEAVKKLEYFHNHLHSGSALYCSATMGCAAKPVVTAFCDAMLGEEAES